MNNNIKIKSSCIPEKTLSINEWCEIYKVGSRIEKYNVGDNAKTMNEQYNFKKLFDQTQDLTFMGRIKRLKLVDLW